MKKILAVIMASMMLLAAAGCKNNAPGGESSAASSSGPAGTSSSASAPGGTVSGTASGTASGAAQGASSSSKPTPTVVKPSVKTTTEDYKFNQGEKYYRADYPQLSGSQNYSGVNAVLKQTALKTISSLGTGNTASFAEVKVSSHISYSGTDFFSATFQESSKTSRTGDSTKVFRAVNYDLKNSKALSTDDLIQRNSAFTAAVKNAVQGQISEKKRKLFTDSVIASGVKNCSIYFKSDGLGVSLPVSASLGSHVELKIAYKDTSGFRKGTVWSNFVK